MKPESCCLDGFPDNTTIGNPGVVSVCLAGIGALWGCEQINLVAVQVIDVTACSMGLVSGLLTESRPPLGVAYAVWYPQQVRLDSNVEGSCLLCCFLWARVNMLAISLKSRVAAESRSHPASFPCQVLSPISWGEGSGSPAVTSSWAHFQSAVRTKKEHGPQRTWTTA